MSGINRSCILCITYILLIERKQQMKMVEKKKELKKKKWVNNGIWEVVLVSSNVYIEFDICNYMKCTSFQNVSYVHEMCNEFKSCIPICT